METAGVFRIDCKDLLKCETESAIPRAATGM